VEFRTSLEFVLPNTSWARLPDQPGVHDVFRSSDPPLEAQFVGDYSFNGSDVETGSLTGYAITVHVEAYGNAVRNLSAETKRLIKNEPLRCVDGESQRGRDHLHHVAG